MELLVDTDEVVQIVLVEPVGEQRYNHLTYIGLTSAEYKDYCRVRDAYNAWQYKIEEMLKEGD